MTNISSLPVNVYIYIYVYMSVYMSQCVLIWSTAYPVYRFLLDPPEEVAEFPGLRFWRAIHSVCETVASAIERGTGTLRLVGKLTQKVEGTHLTRSVMQEPTTITSIASSIMTWLGHTTEFFSFFFQLGLKYPSLIAWWAWESKPTPFWEFCH